MNSMFTAFTSTRASSRGTLRDSQPRGRVIAVVEFRTDDSEIAIHFETAERFIQFCEQHNINYTDARLSAGDKK